MRGIFRNLKKRGILQDVQTLILDGLSVPFELIHEMITDPSFNIRLLSIRQVQNLNERKLMQALEYAVRPTRPEGHPKLRGVYIFGPRDPPEHFRSLPYDLGPSNGGVMTSHGAIIGSQWNSRSKYALSHDTNWFGDRWYQQSGVVVAKQPQAAWAHTVAICEGIISFDAVLCRGPRHQIREPDENAPWYYQPPYHHSVDLATLAVGRCSGCGSAPEGVTVYNNVSNTSLPLLSPLPTHSSTLKAATKPSSVDSSTCMVARCVDCVRHRHCNGCKKWWCEDCYDGADRVADQKYSMQQAGAFNQTTAGSIATEEIYPDRRESENIKVHMGLCVEECLVGWMMSGAGSNGMWG